MLWQSFCDYWMTVCVLCLFICVYVCMCVCVFMCVCLYVGHLKLVYGRLFYRAAVHAAAFGDHVECLQMLLKHKAQIDTIDNLGRSPLMLASQLGQFNIVGQSVHTYS